MTAPHDTPWTPERTERLKVLAAEGEIGSVIATELGITRNAVIGKIHRLKLAWHGAHERLNAGRTKGTGNRGVKRFNFMRPGALVSVPPVKTDRPKRRRKKCTLLNLRANSCRFPLGDLEPRNNKFRFCGDKAVEGHPYCEDHCEVAYQRAKPDLRLERIAAVVD